MAVANADIGYPHVRYAYLFFLNKLRSVYFTCYINITDNFSYEICQSVMDTFIDPTGDETPTEAQTIIDPLIVVEPIEAQTTVVRVVFW